MAAMRFAGMELGVPPAPTGTHKPTDATAYSLLRDSAASGGRANSYGAVGCFVFVGGGRC
jgi:hypothetical protein